MISGFMRNESGVNRGRPVSGSSAQPVMSVCNAGGGLYHSDPIADPADSAGHSPFQMRSSSSPRPAKPADPNSSELKSSGLKATFPRLKILELFQKAQSAHAERHLTAEDIYRMLLTEGMDIGLATVYRVLTQFEQAGLLQRHHFESGKSIFELNEGQHHDHLVCVDCGRVEEFFDAEIEARQSRIAAERGFAVKEHALYLYASCTKGACPHRKSG